MVRVLGESYSASSTSGSVSSSLGGRCSERLLELVGGCHGRIADTACRAVVQVHSQSVTSFNSHLSKECISVMSASSR